MSDRALNRTSRTPMKAIVFTFVITLALVAVTLVTLLSARGTRRQINELLVTPEPLRRAEPFGLRRVVLAERDRALGAGDLGAAAKLNAQLSQEALLRALAVHKAWLDRREPATKLYAQQPDRPEWNYRNTAADFFSFHLHAAMRLNPAAMPSLSETLEAEAKLRTDEGLCHPVIAATGKPVDVDHDELLFGSSEYVKDGLLSVYERHGGGLIGERMLSIIDAIIAQSRHASRFGPIPGTGSEINGNLLQLCGRLSFAENRPQYADFAARIADAMIEQAMKSNGGLPPKFYDYNNDKVIDPTLKLKDHGNEAVLGLAETYAMAVSRREEADWAERASRWEEPIVKMFEMILEHGVNADGMLTATMAPSPPRSTSDKLCDNWGYILSGAILFTDAAKRRGKMDAPRIEAIDRRIDAIARAVFARPIGLPWSGGMDSDADAIESAIYIAAYRPALRDEAMHWADRHIAALYAAQNDGGTAVDGYLDGNFIRTALLYADVACGGWRVEPWREDVLVGLASDDQGNAVVTVSSTQPYTGTLLPSLPRHRSIMNLPWNWARLNSWPEWYAVDQGVRIVNSTGIERPVTSAALEEGLPLDLPANGAANLTLAREKHETTANVK